MSVPADEDFGFAPDHSEPIRYRERIRNYYVGLAASHFGSLALAKADITSSSTVKVLNIWGKNGEDIQSQLIYVPDSGMTAALLGLGLISLAAFRRRKL